VTEDTLQFHYQYYVDVVGSPEKSNEDKSFEKGGNSAEDLIKSGDSDIVSAQAEHVPRCNSAYV
jgi:hypothetical protein